jgi:hypothetical protein
MYRMIHLYYRRIDSNIYFKRSRRRNRNLIIELFLGWRKLTEICMVDKLSRVIYFILL